MTLGNGSIRIPGWVVAVTSLAVALVGFGAWMGRKMELIDGRLCRIEARIGAEHYPGCPEPPKGP
jgi:hypothetical protein